VDASRTPDDDPPLTGVDDRRFAA